MISKLALLSESSLGDLFKPTVFVLFVIAGLIGAVAIFRKRMMETEAGDDPAAGFTLSSLRQLVRDGKMTQEEFDKAKSQIVIATQRATERKAPIADGAPEPKISRNEPH